MYTKEIPPCCSDESNCIELQERVLYLTKLLHKYYAHESYIIDLCNGTDPYKFVKMKTYREKQLYETLQFLKK
jgi:hypothetical protein